MHARMKRVHGFQNIVAISVHLYKKRGVFQGRVKDLWWSFYA